MNQKGLELSVTMIVLLIISVLIFILAISFLWNWYGKAETLKAEIDRQSEEQILSALRQGNSLVSVPINVKQTQRGDSVVFGVGVRNVAADNMFSGAISFADAYLPDGSRNPDVDRDFIDENWLGNFNIINDFSLKRNEMKVLPLLVKAGNQVTPSKGTPLGDYVFDVCIFSGDNLGYCDNSLLGSDNLYSNRIYQLTVRVI